MTTVNTDSTVSTDVESEADMKILNQFDALTTIIMLLMTIFYLYQFLYIIYSLIHRKAPVLKDAEKNHRYAIYISARNEQDVIGELLDSLNNQDYPKDLYDMYVVADNCTDHTAETARNHGAVVFERFNDEEKGKGYALNYLYHCVCAFKRKGYYDACIVFDADNIVDKNFLKEINKSFDTGKYDALTTYRNSKNFGENWLTAAYSIWFMHEARHLNYIRCSLGSNCMISGTGFLVSDKVMQENEGWPFYLLTEDIQFSVQSALSNTRIGYCDSAILYDEQPASWKQAWNQRLRWAKGFYQIDARYIVSLVKGIFNGRGSQKMSCYDVLMTVAPCSLLTIGMIFLAVSIFMSSVLMPYYVRLLFQDEMLFYLSAELVMSWLGLTALAALTVITEWKRIKADTWTKMKYIPLFPVYLLSYLPIAIQAMFVKVEWKPIRHYSVTQIESGR